MAAYEVSISLQSLWKCSLCWKWKLICNAPACPIAGLSQRSMHDRKGNICLPTDRPQHSRMNWTPRISQSRNQSVMAAISGYEAWLQNGTWDLRLVSLEPSPEPSDSFQEGDGCPFHFLWERSVCIHWIHLVSCDGHNIGTVFHPVVWTAQTQRIC